MDYRRMYDSSDMLYSYDLEDAKGRDVVLQIEKVYGGELVGEKGRKSKKPFVKFVGKDKRLALNKTNGKAIARMYGKDADQWAGQWVALYVTTVDYDGEQRDCIRIRPNQPKVPDGKRTPQRKAEAQPAQIPSTRDEMVAALRESIAGQAEPDADELAAIAREEAEASKP